METAKAKSEQAVIWSKQNLEPPGNADGGEETRGDAHVHVLSIDAYSRPGRGTRAEQQHMPIYCGRGGQQAWYKYGASFDAGIAGHSGDILVG